MNLFRAIVRIVTAARYFDSMRRFKTLSPCGKDGCGILRCEVDFTDGSAQSYSLREIRRRVFLKPFAEPADLQASAA
jgi:hypothetical protein